MLSEVWYTVNGEESKALEYRYTVSGQLFSANDLWTQKVTVYEYDRAGRLVGTTQGSASAIKSTVAYSYEIKYKFLKVLNYP